MAKTEVQDVKKLYKYKKHLIHALVVGALALSWGAIGHVSGFIHTHWQPAQQTKTKPATKKQKKNGAGSTLTSDTTSAGTAPPPPPPPPPPPSKASTPSSKVSSVSSAPSNAAVGSEDISKTKVDLNFIRLVEGSVTKGYVPLATTTNSGVTIADGFDLGQMHMSEFNKLPISDALKAKLAPYIGLKRLDAKSFLQSHPLTVNENELMELNKVAANKILIPLAQEYNKNSSVPFDHLPAQAQTAIFSYAYQHGPGFMHSASGRALWSAFTTQNWGKASTLLKAAKMYAGRRHQEAALLDHLA